MPKREIPELGEIFIIEVANLKCWQPVAFALTQEDADKIAEEKRGTKRFRIVHRVRRFISDEGLKIYTDFIRTTIRKAGMSEKLIEGVLAELRAKAAGFNIEGTKTGRMRS